MSNILALCIPKILLRNDILTAKLSQYFAVQVFPEGTNEKKGTMTIVKVLETK